MPEMGTKDKYISLIKNHHITHSDRKRMQWSKMEISERYIDADPGQRDPCVVAAMDKFTWTTEILWRKRDGMATL